MNSSHAIIINGNKILLFHRDNIPTIPYPDHWQLPGGGIEKGETPIEALRRELAEEVTYVPKRIDLLGELKTKFGTAHIYFSYVNDNEANRFEHGAGEGQEIGFFTIDEALKLKISPDFKKRIVQAREIIETAMAKKNIPKGIF